MQIETRLHPVKLIAGFLIDYVRFSQLIPAVCVQGVAVLMGFASILILFQGFELWGLLVQLGFEESFQITSKDPQFWKTMVSVYLAIALVADIFSTIYRLLTKHSQPKKNFFRAYLRWMLIPTIAMILLFVVFIVSSLNTNTSFFELMGILGVFYLIAIVVVLYSLGVDWIGVRVKERFGLNRM